MTPDAVKKGGGSNEARVGAGRAVRLLQQSIPGFWMEWIRIVIVRIQMEGMGEMFWK